MSPTDPDKQRGTDYADGGVSDLNVYYPDPERIVTINKEWEDDQNRTD